MNNPKFRAYGLGLARLRYVPSSADIEPGAQALGPRASWP